MVWFVSASAGAQTAQEGQSYSGEGDAKRLCAYLEAVAASERVLLVSPELFGRVGLVQGGLDEGGDSSVVFEPSARITAGLRYSFNDLVRGNLRRDLAESECANAIAHARVDSFVEAHDEIDMTRAYEAQLVSAEAALADARRMLSTLKASVDSQRATEPELRALRARINRYESLVHDSRIRIASIRRSNIVTVDDEIENLVADVVESEVAVEEERSELRKNAAWDVTVAGGYDKTFGYGSALPVFATVSLAWNFGRFWQGDYEDEALAARRAIHAEGEDSWQEQLERVSNRIERIANAEVAKLADVRAMLVAVRNRREEMIAIGTEMARRYADQLGLDAWDLEIERAYLFGHLEVLRNRLEKLGRDIPEPLREALSVTDTEAVDITTIGFTNGKSDPIGRATVRVNEPKSRAYFNNSSGDSAKITFTYEGPTGGTTELGSGRVRRQIGLKLRAKNGCNLLYVMWRIDPPEGIVVSIKRNDGASNHLQCGNKGYTNLENEVEVVVPDVAPGSQHTLEAKLEAGELVVKADAKVVWKASLAADEIPFTGPAGIRTDNGIFTIVAEAPRAATAAPGDSD